MSLRALKWLVVVMGALIVAGTVTLVVAIVQRLGDGAGAPAPTLALDQPAGARIAGIAAAGDHLAIWLERPDGEGLVVLVDPRRRRVAGEIRPAGRRPGE
ncbi:DUF6476 family protein [Caldovatus sediminis]|uniref:DUF6476 family protein n=1 Tax=Caldovatus sediminis TaxID=2041189 RepID=UPI001E2EDAED|nr:DUF6476 family protein [Caldovatus sediminis]